MLMTGAASAGFTVLTFLSGVIIARLLGVEGRGQYGAVLFWAQFGVVFFAFSFRESASVLLRQEDIPAPERLPSLLLYGIALVVLMLITVLMLNYSGAVQVENVSPLSLVLFVCTVCGIALFSQAFISIEAAKLNFAAVNQDRLIAPGLFVFLVLGLAFAGTAKLEWVLAAFVIGKLPVLTLWLWRYRKQIRPEIDKAFMGRVTRLGAKFHGATVLTLISQQIDRLILVAIWPMERLGFYFVAFSAAGAGFAMVSQAIGLTLLPSLAGCDQAQRRDRLERILRYTVLAAIGFAALIILTAPFVIPLIFGDAFRPAIGYTQGLALALVFVPIRSVVLEANRSVAKGRPGIEMAIVSLVVFLIVYVATGFTAANHLFIAIGAGNAAAIVVGLRHPVAAGDMRLLHGLVPRPEDVIFLCREVWAHLPIPRRRSS